MPRSRRLPIEALCLFAIAGAACDEEASPRLHVERDTVGDTLIVRTVSGSQWGGPRTLRPEVSIGVFEGEDAYMFGRVRSLAVAPDGSIYVMDSQVPALRKYDVSGQYVGTLGREGEGPGEYRGPDGGLAVLSDGRVVLRDPRNARLQVYGPTGEALATWPIRGGFNTSNPLVVDTADRVYTQMLLDPEAAVTKWRVGLVAHDGATGEPVDTFPAPEWNYEEARLVAQQASGDGMNTSVNSVPFSPTASWAFSPYGHMIGGLSTRYAVDQYLGDGTVLRIERVVDPIPVTQGERTEAEAMARWDLRQTQPDWTWNGPGIPDTKPPFRALYAGKDGRIWVLVHKPGERIPDDEVDASESNGPNPRPADRWREPVAFDVFEPDGTFLGRALAPTGFSVSPTPVFDGDRVWAVMRDELDVQYVTRFRLEGVPAGPAG